jgi:hypothetical protein
MFFLGIQGSHLNVGFELLSAVVMKRDIFCNVMPFSLVEVHSKRQVNLHLITQRQIAEDSTLLGLSTDITSLACVIKAKINI